MAIPMPAPRRPVDDDAACCWTRSAEARGDLAQQVVGSAVIALSGVAEAPGNRAERHGRSKRHVTYRVQEIEPAIAFHIKDQVEFARVLVRKEVASLDACGVQQHVDSPAALPHLLDDFAHGVRVSQVNAEIMRCTAGSSYGCDRVVCCLRSLQGRQFLFNQSRGGALAAGLNAREQVTLETVLVGDKALEIGILRVRLGHEIEQVECAARRPPLDRR